MCFRVGLRIIFGEISAGSADYIGEVSVCFGDFEQILVILSTFW